MTVAPGEFQFDLQLVEPVAIARGVFAQPPAGLLDGLVALVDLKLRERRGFALNELGHHAEQLLVRSDVPSRDLGGLARRKTSNRAVDGSRNVPAALPSPSCPLRKSLRNRAKSAIPSLRVWSSRAFGSRLSA